MMTIHHRAANDLDLKAVTHGRGSLWRNLLTASLPGAALAFVVVYFIWRSTLVASLVSAGLFVASLFSNISFSLRVKRQGKAKTDTKAVEVIEVSASQILEIEPVGDNAPAFCFFVDDGKALLLVGQWLLEQDSFPCESFRLCRWSGTKKPIRIEAIGAPVNASHSAVKLRPDHKVGKIEFLNATPETLQEDLDRALTSGEKSSGPR